MLPDPSTVLSVTAYTRRIKSLLEQRLTTTWLKGEISNFRKQTSGHLYFSLKDEGSQIPCVMFRGDAAGLASRPVDGMQIICQGDISVYEPAGRYQFIVRELLEDGAGRLQAEFERLKRKLAEEGLFAPERKKPIPRFPRKVGFVTSPTGAALRDFISILRRRRWNGEVVVLPAKVQGEGAASEVCKRIEQASLIPGLDLLVVGRGGGSLEDLWSFNEEIVARTLASCPLPTISAVGHEIDFTLSDFVADKRAETPSAAAELISSFFVEIQDNIRRLEKGLKDQVFYRMERLNFRLERLDQELQRMDPILVVEKRSLRLDDLEQRMSSLLESRINGLKNQLQESRYTLAHYNPDAELRVAVSRVADVSKRMDRILTDSLRQSEKHLLGLQMRLESASPQSVLRRGFTIFTDSKGRPIQRVEGLVPMQQGKVRFFDGEAEVGIEYVRQNPPTD